MADINVIVLPDGTEYPVSDYYLPVAISSPTAGQVLKYDAENEVWYNGDDAEGSSVFYGTSAPTSQLGVDGNLYVKYTEGTGGASDTVDALYVKLDGAWCQISTGGSGGTSDYNDLTNKPQINSVELSGNKSLDDLGIQPSEISKTATGSIVTFSDGGDNIPVESFECEIVAQQASGTPTPDNPLPITGFNSADIPACGSNIFDEEMEVGTLDNSTGETAIDNNKMRSVNFIPVKPNTTYGVYNNTGVNLYIYSYGIDKSFIEFDNTGMVTGSTFTTDSNTHYIKFRTQNNPSYSNNISINYPSTDTQYHAYTGNTYIVDWGINQWNEDWEVGSLSASGAEIDNPAQFRNVGYIAATPNTTLFIKSPFTAGIQIYQFDSSKTYIRRDFVKDTTITLQSTCAYIRFRTPDASPTVYGNDISINFPATFTGYYPYIPNNPGIVYGGRLIYANGKWFLRATKIVHIFDGTETLISLESGTVFAYDFGTNTLINSQVQLGESISTHYAEVTSGFGWGDVTSGKFLVAGNRYFGCNPNMSLSDYQTFLANQYSGGTPVKAVCLLATPVLIPLTSTAKIKTLSGVNNIFSNTGDSTLKYFTNDADGIEELINVSETSAENTTIDDTNLEYEADNVQEAFEKITKSLTYAEYQALSEEEKNNGTIYFIEDVNGDGQDFQPVIYSEEEREIGVWTDGKPLYEITIDHTFTSGAQSYTVFSSGIDMAFAHTYMVEYSANRWISMDVISKANVNNMVSLQVEKDANGALILNDIGSTARRWIAVIRYTKTTDAAGSGTWTPQGVPAVHYSTDEQVVGTWIDGRTVYEKTLNVGTIGSGTTFAHGITNLDWIIDYSLFGIYAGGNTKLISPANGSSSSIGFVISSWDSTNITFTKGNLSSNFSNCYCTIRYTKTS